MADKLIERRRVCGKCGGLVIRDVGRGGRAILPQLRQAVLCASAGAEAEEGGRATMTSIEWTNETINLVTGCERAGRGKGGDLETMPEDLRIRQWPGRE